MLVTHNGCNGRDLPYFYSDDGTKFVLCCEGGENEGTTSQRPEEDKGKKSVPMSDDEVYVPSPSLPPKSPSRLLMLFYRYEGDTYEPAFEGEEPVEPLEPDEPMQDEDTHEDGDQGARDAAARAGADPVQREVVNMTTGGPINVNAKEKKIPDAERSTTPYMTKYEKARVLGARAVQIA